jgi:hypothetical protein
MNIKRFSFLVGSFLNVLENGPGELLPRSRAKEIQRIRTRLAPFQTILFTSAALKEALFRIASKVWLLPQAVQTHLDRNRFQTNSSVCAPEKANLYVI